MNTFIVYIYRYPETKEPFYIGKGTKGQYRERNHLYEARKFLGKKIPNGKVYNRMKIGIIQEILKQGMEPLIEIYLETKSEQKAKDTEIEMIAKFGRRDIGTGILSNMTDGGDGTSGYTLSDEHKKAISESKKGATQSEETKRLISKKAKGRKMSTETKEKISNTLTGIKRSEEFKLSRTGKNNPNYGKGLPGEKNGMYGRKQSEETKRKISEAIKRKNEGKRKCQE